VLVIQMLGRTRVWRDGTEIDLGPAGRRAVLGLLALAFGQPVTRHELIDGLWGDDPPASATNLVHTHVKHLRRLLEPQRPPRAPSVVLPSVGDGYALALPVAGVDLWRFRDLLLAATGAKSSAGALGEALALWQGAPMADIPVLAGHPRVVALTAQRRLALARYAEAMFAAGRAADVLAMLAEDAAAHPLDESAQARLIRGCLAAGQRARAFAVYESARRLLADELEVEPGPELSAAHRELAYGHRPGDDPRPAARTARAPRQLPAEVPGFVGRARQLDQLDRMPDTATLRLICGTAGVGKTALAVRWAHRVQARFPDGQLYLDLRGYDRDRPLSSAEALRRLLDALTGNGAGLPFGVDQLAARFRTETAGRRMLVVLDNASTVDQVRPLLPGTPDSLVLVTSRDSMAGLVAVDGAQRLTLDLLPEADALALLATLIGDRVRAEPDSASALAGLCARLPLALRVAAELAAARPARPLAGLVAELSDRQRRLDVLDPGGDVRAAVRVVFSFSYQHLDAVAARVFRRLGLHPGPEFDAPAVAALTGVGLRQASRLLDVLVRAHLVQHAGQERFSLHDLLRAHAAELVAAHDPDDQRRQATGRLLDHYLAGAGTATRTLYPGWHGFRNSAAVAQPPVPALTDPAAARSWLDAERPNLTALCHHAAGHGWPGHAIGLATVLHRYLESGRYAEALAVASHGLAAAQQIGDRSAEAHLRTNLGSLHRLLGEYRTATDFHVRALALHRRTGDRHGQARTLSNLGIVLERVGDLTTAVDRHREALALCRAVGERFGEAATLTNLGNVYSGLWRYARAADALDRAAEIFRTLGDRAGQASALANLGEVHTFQGRYRLAEHRLRDALDLFRALHHRNGEATALTNLGQVQIRLGAYRSAIGHLRAALEIFRATGHRYGEAGALNSLGEALHATGHPGEALAAHADALAIAMGTGDTDEQARARAATAAILGRDRPAGPDPVEVQ
jgi:DNA-binding SARP family transcriptional activator